MWLNLSKPILKTTLQLLDRVVQFHKSRDSYKAQIMDVADEVQELFNKARSTPPARTVRIANDSMLISVVESEVIHVLRTEMSTRLDRARFDIFFASRTSQEEIYGKAWDALQAILAITESIHTRMWTKRLMVTENTQPTNHSDYALAALAGAWADI